MRRGVTLAETWLAQAFSDLECAKSLLPLKHPWVYCHVVSKSQQCVEKAIKALRQRLADLSYVREDLRFDHRVNRYLEAFLRMPDRGGKFPEDIIRNCFTYNEVDAMNRLCALAPQVQRDAAQEITTRKNTEYPYQNHTGTEWLAPSEHFSRNEAEHFCTLAQTVYRKVSNLFVQITVPSR